MSIIASFLVFAIIIVEILRLPLYAEDVSETMKQHHENKD